MISTLLFLFIPNGYAFNFNMTEYYQLPQLYTFHDYDRCFSSKETKYCVVETVLEPNKSSNVWNLIVKYNDTKRHFRHDKLQYGLCYSECLKLLEKYERFYMEDNLYLGKTIEESSHVIDPDTFTNGLHDRFDNDRWVNYCVNEILRRHEGLKGRTTVIYCIKSDQTWETDFWDYLFYFMMIVLVVMTVIGSFYDYYCQSNKKSNAKHSLLISFSMLRNIRRLVNFDAPVKGSLEDDLQFLNALRFLTMFCVVGGHVLLFNEIFPTSNPHYIEKKYHEILTMLLANGFRVIETYFIISGLLMSINFMKFLSKEPRFRLKHLMLAIIYRYLRLIPTLIFIILTNASLLIYLQDGPLWKMIAETERSFCRKNWWSSVLFVNNYIHVQDPCLQQSWFLATDFQLTILGMFFMILVTRYPTVVKQVFGAGIFLSFLLPAILVYVNKFEGVMLVTPEEMKYVMWFDKMYQKFYLPTHMNFGPYLFGMIIGVMLYNIRIFKLKLGHSKILTILWHLVVPMGVGVLLSGYIFYENNFDKPSVWIAVYAAVSKNSWGILGLIFILGIVTEANNLVKSFLDHPVFKPLGKITFSVFLCHTFIIRVTLGDIRDLRHLSDLSLLVTVCSTFFLSYLLGFLIHIFVESPCLVLLKKLFKVENHQREATHGIELES